MREHFAIGHAIDTASHAPEEHAHILLVFGSTHQIDKAIQLF